MEVILLERINRLGTVGEVVRVRNGFARNYLIPQKKALRATKENKATIDAQRDALEKQNQHAKEKALELSKQFEGVTVTIVRQASDDGKLYGSVAVRDVSEALAAQGITVERRLINLDGAIKTPGLFGATVTLHADVVIPIRLHVARNAESPIPEDLLDAPKAAASPQSADDVSDEEAA